MASRYDIRSVIIQTLFEADFRNVLDKDHSLKILSRNVLEFLDLTENPEFAENVLLGVILKREVLDEIIQKAAPEWPLSKISIIDRALLRLGLFELIFGETYNIPHKVAINEAIELAKAFGGDSSRKFVNGVLGGIYKEMNVSEKDISSKKIEIIDLSGALVYNFSNQELKIALVYDIFKYWTLPKGRILENEEKADCAIRKIKEELGINAEIENILEENEYISGNEKEVIVKKHVTYFLAKTEETELSVQKDITGILEAKFFTQDEINKLKIYKDIKLIIEKGIQIIQK